MKGRSKSKGEPSFSEALGYHFQTAPLSAERDSGFEHPKHLWAAVLVVGTLKSRSEFQIVRPSIFQVT